MKIKSIKKVEATRHVDITTEKNHNFFANGILTHNCNLPARNVVICGIHRGIKEVDELDIIQMAGRAGRFGIDDAGFVYLVIPMFETPRWETIFKNPRPVLSVLNDESILAFHTIAEIWGGEIKRKEDMFKWYSRSLASLQNSYFGEEDGELLIETLKKIRMLSQKDEESPFLNVTGLGKVSSIMYFSPFDIHDWFLNFSKLYGFYDRPSELPINDVTISWALTDIRSNDLGYIPKDVNGRVSEMEKLFRNNGIKYYTQTNIHHAIAALSLLEGKEEEEKGTLRPMMRGAKFDIHRQAQALYLIDCMYSQWDRDDFWKILPLRIQYGVSDEMTGLVRVNGIGAKKAKLLYKVGIESLDDLLDKNNKEKILKVFSPNFAKKILKNAKELVEE